MGENGRPLPTMVIDLNMDDSDSEMSAMPPFMRHLLAEIVAEDRLGQGQENNNA